MKAILPKQEDTSKNPIGTQSEARELARNIYNRTQKTAEENKLNIAGLIEQFNQFDPSMGGMDEMAVIFSKLSPKQKTLLLTFIESL